MCILLSAEKTKTILVATREIVLAFFKLGRSGANLFGETFPEIFHVIKTDFIRNLRNCHILPNINSYEGKR